MNRLYRALLYWNKYNRNGLFVGIVTLHIIHYPSVANNATDHEVSLYTELYKCNIHHLMGDWIAIISSTFTSICFITVNIPQCYLPVVAQPLFKSPWIHCCLCLQPNQDCKWFLWCVPSLMHPAEGATWQWKLESEG